MLTICSYFRGNFDKIIWYFINAVGNMYGPTERRFSNLLFYPVAFLRVYMRGESPPINLDKKQEPKSTKLKLSDWEIYFSIGFFIF